MNFVFPNFWVEVLPSKYLIIYLYLDRGLEEITRLNQIAEEIVT